MDQKKLCQIAAICGAVVFVGWFMPWLTIEIPPQAKALGISMDTSISGTSSAWTAGWLVMLLGLVGGAAAALTGFGFVKAVPLPQKKQWLIAAGCLAGSALFVLINFFKDFSGPASRGLGLYLCLLASLGGAACMVLVLKNAGMLPKPDATADAPASEDAASKDEKSDD